jgi:hypothetical protein
MDAGKIAECLRCGFLPEWHMASTEIRDRRRTLRYRHLLVRQRVQMKNRILTEACQQFSTCCRTRALEE